MKVMASDKVTKMDTLLDETQQDIKNLNAVEIQIIKNYRFAKSKIHDTEQAVNQAYTVIKNQAEQARAKKFEVLKAERKALDEQFEKTLVSSGVKEESVSRMRILAKGADFAATKALNSIGQVHREVVGRLNGTITPVTIQAVAQA